MAHFAEIKNGVVSQVIVIDNEDCAGGDLPESEAAGQAYIAAMPLPGEWRQTSYSGSFRGKYAGQGDLWDGNEFTSPPAPEPFSPPMPEEAP